MPRSKGSAPSVGPRCLCHTISRGDYPRSAHRAAAAVQPPRARAGGGCGGGGDCTHSQESNPTGRRAAPRGAARPSPDGGSRTFDAALPSEGQPSQFDELLLRRLPPLLRSRVQQQTPCSQRLQRRETNQETLIQRLFCNLVSTLATAIIRSWI